jgi:hypothetical protein
LTYRFQGRDDRLTDVHGKVVKDVLGRAVNQVGIGFFKF